MIIKEVSKSKNYPDDYGFWKVNILCHIPTSDETGSSIETIKEYITKNPKFAIGYLNDVKIEFVNPYAQEITEMEALEELQEKCKHENFNWEDGCLDCGFYSK